MKDFKNVKDSKPMTVLVSGLERGSQGELLSQFLDLPASREEWQNALSIVGEENFLGSISSQYDVLNNVDIRPNSDFESLQMLSEKLDGLNNYEYACLEHYVDYYCENYKNEDLSIAELYSLCCDIDKVIDSIEVYPNVNNLEDLGRKMFDCRYGYGSVPENILENHIDYEQLGIWLDNELVEEENYNSINEAIMNETTQEKKPFKIEFDCNDLDVLFSRNKNTIHPEDLHMTVTFDDGLEDSFTFKTPKDINEFIDQLTEFAIKCFDNEEIALNKAINFVRDVCCEYSPAYATRLVTAKEHYCNDRQASFYDLGQNYVEDYSFCTLDEPIYDWFDFKEYAKDCLKDETYQKTDDSFFFCKNIVPIDKNRLDNDLIKRAKEDKCVVSAIYKPENHKEYSPKGLELPKQAKAQPNPVKDER